MEVQGSATKTLRNLLEHVSSTSTGDRQNEPTHEIITISQTGIKTSPILQQPVIKNEFSYVTSPNVTFESLAGHQITFDDSLVRRTRTVIPLSVKCQITKMAEENPRVTQGEIAQMFGIDRTTVSKILKRRREYIEDTSVQAPKMKMSRLMMNAPINTELEEALHKWYLKLREQNIVMTQSMIIEKAETLGPAYGAAAYSFDKNWLNQFLDRYKITCKDVFVTDIEASVHHNSSQFSAAESNQSDQIDITNIVSQYPLNQFGLSPDIKAGMALKAGSLKKAKAQNIERLLHRAANAPSSTISSSQRLLQPKPTSQPIPNHACHSGSNKIPKERVQAVNSTSVSESDITSSNMKVEDPNMEMYLIKEEVDPVEINAEEALSREMGNLEKFRESQKHMEEANKQRKALLAKTLNERQRKAREEAEKLSHIQKELHKLDNLLSADVTVIRSRIEIASRDFLEAQKRYDRAEREFVEAKMELQSTSELKEQLTEHLYTIIHQNEVRKSKKLAELMKELEMDSNDECVQLPELPPLSSFSSMPAAQTFHSPKSPTSEKSPEKPKNSEKELSEKSPKENQESTLSQEKQSEVSDQQKEKESVSDETEKDAKMTHFDSVNRNEDLINFSPSKTSTNTLNSKPDSDSSVEKSESDNQQDSVEVASKSPQDVSNTEKSDSQVVIKDSQSKVSHSNCEQNSTSEISDKIVKNAEVQNDKEKAEEENSVIAKTPEVEIPSSWTLNLVNIKKEPDT
ncbi:hypothetical protein KUTeg_022563 [Tegillarca granosa]|uniref:RAB6-interacting golgin n=1 Tax=Tegillarca granosa TaxID=220873 RepID=A0ABQ9E6S4_TEGGR|nr:hypothetical protein KUTeg_022563 [Tegillarca granosa]